MIAKSMEETISIKYLILFEGTNIKRPLYNSSSCIGTRTVTRNNNINNSTFVVEFQLKSLMITSL